MVESDQSVVHSEGDTLSSDDVLEIKKFAHGKTRIVDLTERLLSRSAIDPFSNFVRVDVSSDGATTVSPSEETICAAWSDLEDKLQQVVHWQDERDAIEAEAARFEVGDMERLRQVAKAASERELSAGDTDLIEITVQTLVALDTLLRLLKSRREALEVYHGRLQWEERRKDCWSSYASLSQDMDDFVGQARWSPLIYQRKTEDEANFHNEGDQSSQSQSTALPKCSPETARSTPGSGFTSMSFAKKRAALIKSKSTALSHRCRSFFGEVVPRAAASLDEVIEMRQLPEDFLDEQDRLEDLAESIRTREVFLIQLSMHWRKADELYRLSRSFHVESRRVHSIVSAAQKDTPTRECLVEVQAQTRALQKRMEALCGAEASMHFINDIAYTTESASEAVLLSLPEAASRHCPDQEQHSAEARQLLSKEIRTALKYTRSVCQSSTRYEAALVSKEKVEGVLSQMRKLCAGFVAIKDDVKQRSVGSSGATIESGHAPPLHDALCLDHSSYDSELVFLAECQARSAELQQRLTDSDALLQNGLAACVQNAMSARVLRREAEEVKQEVIQRQKEGQTALDEYGSTLSTVQEARKVYQDLLLLQEGDNDLASEVTNLHESTQAKESRQTMTVEQLRDKSVLHQRHVASAGLSLKSLAIKLRDAGAPQVLDVLEERLSDSQGLMKRIGDAIDWLDMQEKQRQDLSAFQEEVQELKEKGFKERDKLKESIHQARYVVSLPAEEQQSDGLEGAQERSGITAPMYALVAAAHSRITLCGSTPPLLNPSAKPFQPGEGVTAPSVDVHARAQVNQWCSMLSSLAQEIEATAQQRETLHREHLNKLEKQKQELASTITAHELLHVQGQNAADALEKLLPECGRASSTEEIERSREDLLSVTRRMETAIQAVLRMQADWIMSCDAQSRCSRLKEQHSAFERRAIDLLQSAQTSIKESKSRSERWQAESLEKSWRTQSVVEEKDIKPLEASMKVNIDETTGGAFDASGREKRGALFQGIETISQIDGPTQNGEKEVDKTVELPEANSSTINPDGASMKMEKETVHELRPDMRETIKNLAAIDEAVEEQTHANGLKQLQMGLNLPTTEQAMSAKSEWVLVKARAEQVLQQYHDVFLPEEINKVRTRLQVHDAKVRRMTHLASFSTMQSRTSDSLSSLLEQMDRCAEGSSNDADVESCVRHAEELVKQASSAAEPVMADVRVRHQLSQLRHSFQDLQAMASGNNTELDRLALSPSRASSLSSLLSFGGSVSGEEMMPDDSQPRKLSTPRFDSSEKLADLVPSRSMIPRTPQSVRSRAYSNCSTTSSSGIPVAVRRGSPHSLRSKQGISESASQPAVPSSIVCHASRDFSMTPRVLSRDRSMDSLASSAAPRTPPRKTREPWDLRSLSESVPHTPLRETQHTPRSHRSASSTTKPNHYRANPKSKLDVAVAKIVNKMPMQVRITHASVENTKVKEPWHDESGRYWVGHPDPKLCFCRILRSRTVMVRIGGGWQELSTYIVKHYAHLAPESSLSVAPSPAASPYVDRSKTAMEELPWTDSATLLATPKAGGIKSQTASVKDSPESAFLTPMINLEWKRESPRRSASPVSLRHSVRDAESGGLWIRQERKASQTAATRAADGPQQATMPEMLDHTRSTLSSRSRRISQNKEVGRIGVDRIPAKPRLSSSSQHSRSRTESHGAPAKGTASAVSVRKAGRVSSTGVS